MDQLLDHLPELVGLSAFMLGALLGVIRVVLRERDAAARISRAESSVEEQPEKAMPAWNLAQAKLEKYLDRNLNQVSVIFVLCAGVMGIGLYVIIWGTTQALKAPDSTLPAIIAGLAGVITEAIGATFLVIYRSTMQQAASYFGTLERINSVGMAMQILDTMPNSAKGDSLKNSTKADVVRLLMQHSFQGKEGEAVDISAAVVANTQ
jgi:hypothetical protein